MVNAMITESINRIHELFDLYEISDFLDIDTCSIAIKFISNLHSTIISHNMEYRNPTITVENETENIISFEWWRNSERSLSIFVSSDYPSPQYLKVWGPNMVDEMEDGEIWNDSELLILWKWYIDD